MKHYAVLLVILLATTEPIQAQEDKYLWLEEIDGKNSLEFVKKQNESSVAVITKQKDYKTIYEKSLEIYNSSQKIAYPSIRGKYVYNFWKDKDHERGIWRRTLKADYIAGKATWQTLLDIDALAKKDSIKWVYKGANGLYPDYNRFLVQLSKGGGDAVVIKEFDADKKQFVENGFFLNESKGGADFVDENTLIIYTNFGAGTLTTSGYPKQAKLWKRATPLKDAQLIYDGDSTDLGTFGWVLRDGEESYVVVTRALTIFRYKVMVWLGGKLITLDIPDDCTFNGILKNQAIIQLKSDWKVNDTTYQQGSMLSLDFSSLLQGNKNIKVILKPDEFSSITEVSTTKNHLLVNLLSNVTSQLYSYSYNNGTWQKVKVKSPDLGTVALASTDEFTDQYFFSFENFVTPSTLFSADAGAANIKAIKSLPAYFDGNKFEVKQFKARSKDGTMIPYFMVSAKNIKRDGTNPTLINAYGGFEISSQPLYESTFGVAWLGRGGVFVLANIRGGGEFGPKWHQAGIKENRQKVYDDFYAVSEDIIAQKISSPKHLGILGGSNGGLLVGVAFTQRPELYNAVTCMVPLLDMHRYNKLLAGASWMGEYGDPDKAEEWQYLQKYSPYHNLKPGVKYPEVFFTTSTRDDRVHPGHARKMVAKMNDMGYKTYYYENIEGGHAGASTNEQRAKVDALMFSYFLMKLK